MTEAHAARAAILARIRRSLGRDRPAGAARAAIEDELAHPGPNLIPKRAQVPPAERRRLFVAMAREASASVTIVASPAEVPQAIADFLKGENLPARLRLAPDPALARLPFADMPLLETSVGPTRGEDPVSLTGVFAAIAETGTLAIASGPASPTTLNFLPDTHIALVEAGQVMGSMEEVWAKLRAAGRLGPTGARTVNLITGPSRSADIEQKLQMGAHGPRRLHIILIDDEA